MEIERKAREDRSYNTLSELKNLRKNYEGKLRNSDMLASF